MAPEREQEEVEIRRIIACFAPGSAAAPAAIAELAKQMRADLLGLFIEDTDLLRFAAFPFAAEIGHATAVPRSLDLAAVERALRHQADSLREAFSALLDPASLAWSFRVARASPADAIRAALAEGYAPSLLLPPGVNPHAQRRVVRAPDLDRVALRELLAVGRPVLVLPE